MQLYVLALAFKGDKVLLVRKNEGPQNGKLNGIGGKIEDAEDAYAAMQREWEEEIGSPAPEFEQIGEMCGVNLDNPWKIALFKSEIRLTDLQLPKMNDVGEQLGYFEVWSCFKPEFAPTFAQNIPTMVAHALMGEGILELVVGAET